MGLSYRRTKSFGGLRFTATQHGVHASTRIGPFRFSSSGRNSMHLGRGLTFRFPRTRL